MQEKSVTVAGQTHRLAPPFFVMATQNPIEQEGTYPLPEAQLDRFLLKLNVGYSALEELLTIIDRTTGAETPAVEPKIDGPKIIESQQLVRSAIVAPHVKEYAARLTLATHPEGELAPRITNQYVRVGASPRAAQSLILCAKVRAVVDGRYHVSYDDVRRVALPALRHRVILNFEAEADRVDPDAVVESILEATPTEPVLTGR
jgi:MoxR-like ATPase